jgi:hypothetical protein
VDVELPAEAKMVRQVLVDRLISPTVEISWELTMLGFELLLEIRQVPGSSLAPSMLPVMLEEPIRIESRKVSIILAVESGIRPFGA